MIHIWTLKRCGILLALAVLGWTVCGLAQEANALSGQSTATSLEAAMHLLDAGEDARWHTTIEIAFGVAVLAFGCVMVLLEVLFLKGRPSWDPAWSLKILGLTLVLTSGLFLIVAGFSQTQIAPMMGLLGTVAGYLLGKDARPPDSSTSQSAATG